MSNTIWSFARLRQERLAAAAFAVACTQKQQETSDVAPTCTPDDVDDAVSDDDSVRPRDLVKSSGNERLQQKFLNRLAEIFARQKTPHNCASARTGAATDADHVAATMLSFKADKPVVYLAKNAGLDGEDKKLLAALQLWLRTLVLCGQRRRPEDDKMWQRLVEFNRPRLEFYVWEVAKVKDHGKCESVVELQHLCEAYNRCSTSSREDLLNIIAKAYDLRYRTPADFAPRVLKFIGLLSRLRAAWETLQEYAMHHSACKDIELCQINAAEPIEIPQKQIRMELDLLCKGLSNRTEITKELKRYKRLRLHTHAEMQLLLFSSCAENQSKGLEFLPYIGSSKKTCWLCEQMLRGHGYFKSRGTHGKVSAHWTVQTGHQLEIHSLLALTEGLYHIQEILVDRACAPLRTHRSAVAESTAAVTTSRSAASIAKIRHRQRSGKQSFLPKNEATSHEEGTPKIFGKFLYDITAIRLPADTIGPDTVPFRVFERGPEVLGMGLGSTVLDFRPFWGDFLHIEQDHQMLDLTDQAEKANDGTFLVFYNLHEDLLPNKHIASILGTDFEGSFADSRLFWRGDVFVVRYQDSSTTGITYTSIPPNAGLNDAIEAYLRNVWESDGLQELLDSRKEADESIEKSRRDLETVRARL